MEKEIARFLKQVDAYVAKAGIAASSFGLYAVNDGKFISSLKSGKRSWPERIERARKYMTENPPQKKKKVA